MRKLATSLILFLFLALSGCGEADDEAPPFYVNLTPVHYQIGDNPAWANPAFDVSDWPEAQFQTINSQGEIVWVRTHFEGTPILESRGDRPIGLYIIALAAEEVYLNGVLVGGNGTPALSADEEVPGKLDAVFYLPVEMINPGENTLAVRLSSHHVAFPIHTNLYDIVLAPYQNPTSSRLNLYLPSLPLLGVFILGALFFGLRGALGKKDPASLWLGIASLMVAGQMGAEASRAFINYSYDWHLVRILAIYGFAFAFGLALTAFAGFRFLNRFPTAWLAAGLAVGALIAIFTPGFDGKTALTLALFLILAVAIAAQGWKAASRDAKPLFLVMVAIVALILPWFGLFLDRYYYFAMAFFLLSLFAMEVVTARKRERDMHRATVQSARLELELLKRNIQPHFLMNTLTALAEWMEKNPREGSRMIDALAEEFRLLHDMAEKKTVPLKTELALCDAHLKLMEFRKNQSYSLEKKIANPEVQIPPVIFHTLIENAITHGKLGNRDVRFVLEQKSTDSGLVYTFIAPLGKGAGPAGAKGLGTAYIEARLKEAYGDNFQLEHGTKGQAWVTTIKLPDGKAT